MFNGDLAYQRLWRRITRRYPFARGQAFAKDAQALFERDPDFTYRVLKAVGDERRRVEVAQLRAFFNQMLLLPPKALGQVDPQPVFEVLFALPLEQAQRWFHFGLHRFPEQLEAYLSGAEETSALVFEGLVQGLSAFDNEHVLRYYSDALAGGKRKLKFLPADSTAPAHPQWLTLPDRVAAYPLSQDGEEDAHFLLFKWLITHAQSHRQAGTYRWRAKDEAQGRANLNAWLNGFADPLLLEALFHLFEDVRAEAHLLRQYPGFRVARQRLMSLELAFRPHPRNKRQRFLEALLQRLHWDEPNFNVPAAWRRPLEALCAAAAALRQPSATVDASVVLAETAYDNLGQLFAGPPLDEPLHVVLLPYEARLLLSPPGADGRLQQPQTAWAKGPKEHLEEVDREPSSVGDGALPAHAQHYDEWDYHSHQYRLKWCALHEGVAPQADAITALDAHQVNRVRRAFEWMAQEDWVRQKRQLQGDEVDVDAWVEGCIDRRAGLHLPEKLYNQALRKRRELCAAILLDQSDSTARLTPSGQSVIEVERKALRYLCEALEVLHDEYAIFAYSGEGRKRVDCFTLKAFDEAYGLKTQRRLEALCPLSQNRDGCALRHLTRVMLTRQARTKLLLHITDGRPWDHDYTQRYALEDAKRAVQEAQGVGVKVFGVICDPHAPAYVRHTYGPGRYVIVEHLDDLAKRLLGLYRRVTR